MRLFALCKLRVEEEGASLAGFCEFLCQVSCSGFFLHLLADKSHQSFVVNMAYVKSVESLELVMTTGERIPISQPKRKDFMMKLTDFWGDML